MDITQILLGIGAVVGIVIVCVLAIVPTVMGLERPRQRPPLRPVDGTHRRGAEPAAATQEHSRPDGDHQKSVDLAA